ncbi:MAG: Crp/Fnr family transcriptional regulator [Mucilaginibacter sp.]
MFKAFRDYIFTQCTLTEQELEQIGSACVVRHVRKKQYLLQEGEVAMHTTFLVSGCMRMYRVDDQGNEHILIFGTENWWMMDKESFITGNPSKYFIEALEDCQVLLWPKAVFQQFVQQIPALATFMHNLVNTGFMALQNRVYESISLTAEEKYHNFIKTYPDIFNRVPLHMIASYLGVSRETLSRVRNQYAYK